ncbi:transposase [Arthrobacter citreus]|nr:transposase [Arthrobacter citreus]
MDETLKNVKYILVNQKPVAQLARETGVNLNILNDWIKKFSDQPEVKAVQTFSPSEAELRALQKEMLELKVGNEILKNAMHYFSYSTR